MRRDTPALVVLDVIGTTVLDDGVVVTTFADTLSAHGLEVSQERLTELRGLSKRESIARLVAPEPGGAADRPDPDLVYATFEALLSRRYASAVRAVPGAAEAIAALRERGTRVALNTGLDRGLLDVVLDALGWRAVADLVVCGEDVAHGRPAPDLIRCAMERAGIDEPALVANVGDTAADLRAGHAAGVGENIGVLTGAHDRERLEREPHTRLVGSVAELPGLWSAPGDERAPAQSGHDRS